MGVRKIFDTFTRQRNMFAASFRTVVLGALLVALSFSLSACGKTEAKVTGEENADLNGRWGELTIAEYTPGTDSFLVGWDYNKADTRVYYSRTMVNYRFYVSKDECVQISIAFHPEGKTPEVSFELYYRDSASGKFKFGAKENVPFDNIKVSEQTIKVTTTEGLTLDQLDLNGEWGSISGQTTIKIKDYSSKGFSLAWRNPGGSTWMQEEVYKRSSPPGACSGDKAYWFKSTTNDKNYIRIAFLETTVTVSVVEGTYTSLYYKADSEILVEKVIK